MNEETRGFGIAGALDHGIIGRIAPDVERMKYATLWANDTPNGDGLAALAVAAGVTTSIRLGVGVIPVDRVPAERIADRVEQLGLPKERLLVGIGAGGTKQGSLELVREACAALHRRGIAAAVGALGPKMIALAGSDADAVLLNWLTPGAAVRAVELLRAGTANKAEAIAYVRVAFGAGSEERLEQEALRYESFPQYSAHFGRMGVRAIDTCVSGPTAAALQAGLSAFAGTVDEVVVRAVTGEESLEAYQALAEAAAPSGQ